MSDHSDLLEMSDEEAEFLDSVFNTKVHGEVRIEKDKTSNQLTINWFDNYPLSFSVFSIETYADKAWASSLSRLHEEYVKNKHAADNAQKLAHENQYLKEQIASLNRKIFGTSSEQSAPSQIEIDQSDLVITDNDQVNSAAQASDKQSGKLKLVVSNAGRKKLPPHLTRERIEYKLPLDKQFCECCAGKLQEFGEEVIERLTVIPAQYKVIQHAKRKYICRKCHRFTMAEAPKSLIPRSSYGSPEILADIVVKRFQHGLPYYRQEAIFNQAGLPFNRTTLANLVVGCAKEMTALYESLKYDLRNQKVIHADETSFQVLKEAGRSPQSNSYLWLFRSGCNATNQVVLYEYQPTRSGTHPVKFLTEDEKNCFKGYLLTDGYAGYNNIPGVIRVGCMAHVRRKFEEAFKALPAGGGGSHAQHAIKMIGKLYAIERKSTDQPPKIKYQVRQAESLPILHEMKLWLDKLYPDVVPRSLLGKAIGYAIGQWDYVSRYIDDGRLSIDNNIAEREIKAFVIGRKNWLFADSVEGAEANAVMYSLVQTAKANGLDPYKYLYHVFERMPYMQNSQEVQSLLPWNVKITDEESIKLAA